jgi:hypothetical protein
MDIVLSSYIKSSPPYQMKSTSISNIYQLLTLEMK